MAAVRRADMVTEMAAGRGHLHAVFVLVDLEDLWVEHKVADEGVIPDRGQVARLPGPSGSGMLCGVGSVGMATD